MNDRFFMERAITLARKGYGCTSPNPLVGAVVVRDGEIVGEGWHARYGGPHAEVHALEAAGKKAEGATIYVSLEPCNHQGKTPPCTEAVIRSGISRVVMAMEDPNPKASGGIARLCEAGIEVLTGLCEKEARMLNAPFIKMVETGLPWVVLKSAMTLDGMVATKTGDSKWVTGEASRSWCHEHLRQRLDAILVGSGTVRADNPGLTCRLPNGGGRNPLRIILASSLNLDPEAEIFKEKKDSGTLIVCAEGIDSAKMDAFVAKGARILEIPLAKEGGLDLGILMQRLGKMGVQSILIEGGAHVAASALKSRIVDALVLFYAPKILGGEGLPVFSGKGPERMSESIGIRDMEIFRTGDDFRLEGYPSYLEE